MEPIKSIMNLVAEQLAAAGNCDLAITEPMTMGPYSVLVVASTSLGMGAGGGEGEGVSPSHGHGKKHEPAGVKGKGTGTGAGAGVKVRPVGVIALGPQGVQVMPIPDKPGLLDKLFDKIPALAEKLQAMFPDEK
jgi:uncharacterized spore protein YtfJ